MSEKPEVETRPQDARPRAKLRIGRLIFVIILIVLIYMAVSWVRGNAHRVKEIESKMLDLSGKLDEQGQNAKALNGSLARFSRELAKVNNALDNIQQSVAAQGQISDHDMKLVKDELKNIKSKIENIRIQSRSYGGNY